MRRMLATLDTKGALGFGLLALVALAAILAPLISPFDPNAQDLLNPVAPPAWAADGATGHLLGTDRLGQDVLSRIIYGSRVSLLAAFSAVAVSAAIGTLLGLVAGYFGGIVATAIMRLVDIMLAIPFILLALVFMTVFGPSLVNLVIAFAFARWVQYTRIAYGLVLEIREREFIQACITSGVSTFDILFRHILINIAWWLTTFPGLAIMLTVVGFNFVGDWLRDRFDPRTDVGRSVSEPAMAGER